MDDPPTIAGDISQIETIASGRGVLIRRSLNRAYGTGRWRKLKVVAIVRLTGGTMCEAEVHWYEAHGIGRKDLKVKRVIRWIAS